MKNPGEADSAPVTATRDWRCPILPRRRHLPLASTEGSLTENLNKTAVRLWTSPRLQCQR